MYQCQNVGFSYKLDAMETPAIIDLTCEIPRGSFFGLSGPSGSGKSTLLNLLGLIESPHKGQIFFDGNPVSSLPESEKNHLRRFRRGFVFQSFQLIDVLTVEENVEYFLVRQNVPHKIRQELVSASLEKTGIYQHRTKRPNQLSGGQKQRVAIARALAKRPAVIIADEPTASLDGKTGAQVMDLLAELNNTDKLTIVMSSHDPKVLNYCTHIMTLVDGQFGSIIAQKP